MTPDTPRSLDAAGPAALERRILEALHGEAPQSAKELGLRLGVPGHDVSRVMAGLLAREVVTARPRDEQREVSHTNPRVYRLT